MNCVTVRSARPEDIPEIMNIIHEAFLIYMENGCLPSPPSALFETEDELRLDMEKKCVLAAEIKGRVSGTIRLEFDGERAYLSRFAVAPSLHRSGIGKALLNEAEAQARTRNVRELSLHTSLEAKNIVRLYKEHGYIVRNVNCDLGYKRAELVKKLQRV